MRSGYIHVSSKNRLGKGKPPSLVDLCVQVAVDNIRYIGNVGPTDSHLLDRILPHCTVEQLMHIENATTDRDLSPITNKLWRRFYEAQFSAKNAEVVAERMARKGVTFSWRQLYQAKLKCLEEEQKEKVESLAQKYRMENAQKQSRRIQICTKIPPSFKKRSFGGAFGASSSFSNVKSNLLKKAKVEYSAEIKNRVAVKKAVVHTQKTNSVRPIIRPQTTMARPQSMCKKANVSNSKFFK